MTTRTTHRSKTGTKLYAVRNADGTFKDILILPPNLGHPSKRHGPAQTAQG